MLRPSITPPARASGIWEIVRSHSQEAQQRKSVKQYNGFTVEPLGVVFTATTLVVLWLDRWDRPMKNVDVLKRIGKSSPISLVVRLNCNHEVLRFLEIHCGALEHCRIRIITNSFRERDGYVLHARLVTA